MQLSPVLFLILCPLAAGVRVRGGSPANARQHIAPIAVEKADAGEYLEEMLPLPPLAGDGCHHFREQG